MGHFSVEIYDPPGSTLSANQHTLGDLKFDWIKLAKPKADGQQTTHVVVHLPANDCYVAGPFRRLSGRLSQRFDGGCAALRMRALCPFRPLQKHLADYQRAYP